MIEKMENVLENVNLNAKDTVDTLINYATNVNKIIVFIS